MMRALPAFTLPSLVARVGAHLPARPPARLVCLALDFGVGRIVSRDAIAPLAGKRFALTVRDLGVTLRFAATPRGFRPVGGERAPDLAIGATLRDFIALALRDEDPDTMFFARRLTLEGDTELGLAVKNLLDGIDWQALLARLPLAPAWLRR
jgi:predicted lipid carrier protein YhbT